MNHWTTREEAVSDVMYVQVSWTVSPFITSTLGITLTVIAAKHTVKSAKEEKKPLNI